MNYPQIFLSLGLALLFISSIVFFFKNKKAINDDKLKMNHLFVSILSLILPPLIGYILGEIDCADNPALLCAIVEQFFGIVLTPLVMLITQIVAMIYIRKKEFG